VTRQRLKEEHRVVIDRLAYGGEGVGRLPGEPSEGGGMAVFVPRTAPGDTALVRLHTVKRRHAEAEVIAIEQPGPGRRETPCPHFAEGCGGCSWQHLDDATQRSAKETMVRDSLERIGGYRDLNFLPIITADDPFYYRNKMEFAFNARDGLGFHPKGRWSDVIPVTACQLQSELAMRIVACVRTFAEKSGLPLWDPSSSQGFLRELIVRHGTGTGQTMVGLVTTSGDFSASADFVEQLRALDPGIVSIVRGIRDGVNDGSPIESASALWGEDAIVERVSGLEFRVGLQTFFQTNTNQAARMLDTVCAFADLPAGGSDGIVLDVFCGVGFFTLALARRARLAMGVELVEASISAARVNAGQNQIENAFFYAGDARHTVPAAIEKHGVPSVVVLDPPRSGAGGKVMRRIARTQAPRVVYVSCNPTTLARDLKEMEPYGYRITRVQAIDLFPQTYHVETVVELQRLDEPTERKGLAVAL